MWFWLLSDIGKYNFLRTLSWFHRYQVSRFQIWRQLHWLQIWPARIAWLVFSSARVLSTQYQSVDTSFKASSQAVMFWNYFLIMRVLRFLRHSQEMSYIERKWEKIRGKGGNGEKYMNWRGRKCLSVSISPSLHCISLSPFPLSPHFLILPFPLHFLILSSFPRSPATRLQQVVTAWEWAMSDNSNPEIES